MAEGGEKSTNINTAINPKSPRRERVHSSDPLNVIVERERQATVAQEFSKLSSNQQEVLQSRVISDQPETLQKIGTRLGVTRERVRQLQNDGLKILRKSTALQELDQPEFPLPPPQSTTDEREPKTLKKDPGVGAVITRLTTFLGTKEVVTELQKRIANGDSYGKIARKAGISYEEMKRYTKRLGLT